MTNRLKVYILVNEKQCLIKLGNIIFERKDMMMKKLTVVFICVCVIFVAQPNRGAEAAISDKNYKVYESLIVEWKSAMDNMKIGNYLENDELDFSFYDNSGRDSFEAYYALHDIDGNGVKELILNKRSKYEDIIAYIFTLKDGKPVNVFGYSKNGIPTEVPWSRNGSSRILENGLIDSREGNDAIYRIAGDGYSVKRIAHSEPGDYPDEASRAEAVWRYFVNDKRVDYDSYVQYLKKQGYSFDGNNKMNIDWKRIK
jgi:hypothetical protein